jgi:hypothetical protein
VISFEFSCSLECIPRHRHEQVFLIQTFDGLSLVPVVADFLILDVVVLTPFLYTAEKIFADRRTLVYTSLHLFDLKEENK